jgi:hypothetical protein
MSAISITAVGHDEAAMISWAVQTILNAIIYKLKDCRVRTVEQVMQDVERAAATVNQLHDEATAKCPPTQGECDCNRIDTFTALIIDAAYRIVHAPDPTLN